MKFQNFLARITLVNFTYSTLGSLSEGHTFFLNFNIGAFYEKKNTHTYLYNTHTYTHTLAYIILNVYKEINYLLCRMTFKVESKRQTHLADLFYGAILTRIIISYLWSENIAPNIFSKFISLNIKIGRKYIQWMILWYQRVLISNQNMKFYSIMKKSL